MSIYVIGGMNMPQHICEVKRTSFRRQFYSSLCVLGIELGTLGFYGKYFYSLSCLTGPSSSIPPFLPSFLLSVLLSLLPSSLPSLLSSLPSSSLLHYFIPSLHLSFLDSLSFFSIYLSIYLFIYLFIETGSLTVQGWI